MKKLLLLVALACLVFCGCASTKEKLFDGKSLSGWALYLGDKNADVTKTWSVQGGIVRCTGKPAGYMRTQTEHSNYRLHVEWRWPDRGGNSGVLLHMSGPDKVWPKSIECQLMSGNAGDFWLIDGTEIAEHINKSARRVPKKYEGAEKPLGKWNEYDIYCRGNTISVYINGKLVNQATEATVSSGKICLQSEGAPIEFRNIFIDPLD